MCKTCKLSPDDTKYCSQQASKKFPTRDGCMAPFSTSSSEQGQKNWQKICNNSQQFEWKDHSLCWMIACGHDWLGLKSHRPFITINLRYFFITRHTTCQEWNRVTFYDLKTIQFLLYRASDRMLIGEEIETPIHGLPDSS